MTYLQIALRLAFGRQLRLALMTRITRACSRRWEVALAAIEGHSGIPCIHGLHLKRLVIMVKLFLQFIYSNSPCGLPAAIMDRKSAERKAAGMGATKPWLPMPFGLHAGVSGNARKSSDKARFKALRMLGLG